MNAGVPCGPCGPHGALMFENDPMSHRASCCIESRLIMCQTRSEGSQLKSVANDACYLDAPEIRLIEAVA